MFLRLGVFNAGGDYGYKRAYLGMLSSEWVGVRVKVSQIIRLAHGTGWAMLCESTRALLLSDKLSAVYQWVDDQNTRSLRTSLMLHEI